MAKLIGNKTFAISGQVDGLVYRQTREGVVVARRPRVSAHAKREQKPSAALAAQQERLRAANLYARRVLSDPLVRRAYERLGMESNRRFDRMVIGDYLTPPEIEQIELAGYQRRPGDRIRVLAFDDVEVVSVRVAIHTAAGALVEEGAAGEEQGVWNYHAAVVAPPEPLVIGVTAKDRAENETTAKVAYP